MVYCNPLKMQQLKFVSQVSVMNSIKLFNSLTLGLTESILIAYIAERFVKRPGGLRISEVCRLL